MRHWSYHSLRDIPDYNEYKWRAFLQPKINPGYEAFPKESDRQTDGKVVLVTGWGGTMDLSNSPLFTSHSRHKPSLPTTTRTKKRHVWNYNDNLHYYYNCRSLWKEMRVMLLFSTYLIAILKTKKLDKISINCVLNWI